ncbi:MAG: hypothetical protein II841_08790 [Bacteroidales bacterium]|nr:hypothetical protein [Bacteroidales bacterium]
MEESQEKVLLKVSYDKDGKTVVEIPNSDDAVIAITNHIHDNIVKRNTGPLDVMFSIVVHFLAMDLSGSFEKQFIRNIKATTPKYREGYRAMRAQLMKPKS